MRKLLAFAAFLAVATPAAAGARPDPTGAARPASRTAPRPVDARGVAAATTVPSEPRPEPATEPAAEPAAEPSPPGAPPAPVAADEPPAPLPGSDGPPGTRPPDPRRGERLDGRAAPRDPKRYAYAFPRLVLSVPRAGARLLFYPILRGAYFAEEHKLTKRSKDALSFDGGRLSIRPVLKYQSGFSPSLGARVVSRDHLTPGLRAQLRGRTNFTTTYAVDAAVAYHHSDAFVPALSVGFEHKPDALFAGIQGVSSDGLDMGGRPEARYAYDRLEVSLGSRPRGWLTVAPRVDFERARYDEGLEKSEDRPIGEVYCARPGEGGCLEVDEMLVPGFERGLTLVRGGGTLRVDTRPPLRNAGGLLVEVDGALAEGVAGDPSRHATVAADVRGIIGLPLERAFVLRARAGLVEPLGDAPVPFEELMTPGGRDGLRALSRGRLRGHSELLVGAEYRWLIATWLDGALFADYGGAFERGFAGITTDRLVPSVGAGVVLYQDKNRYWEGRELGGIATAWAPGEGFRFLLTASLD